MMTFLPFDTMAPPFTWYLTRFSSSFFLFSSMEADSQAAGVLMIDSAISTRNLEYSTPALSPFPAERSSQAISRYSPSRLPRIITSGWKKYIAWATIWNIWTRPSRLAI